MRIGWLEDRRSLQGHGHPGPGEAMLFLCAAPPVKKLELVVPAVLVVSWASRTRCEAELLLSVAMSVKELTFLFTAVLVVSCAQVANKDYQWAY